MISLLILMVSECRASVNTKSAAAATAALSFDTPNKTRILEDTVDSTDEAPKDESPSEESKPLPSDEGDGDNKETNVEKDAPIAPPRAEEIEPPIVPTAAPVANDADNKQDVPPVPVPVVVVTAAPVSVLAETAAPVSKPLETAAPVSIPVETAAPVSLLAETAAPQPDEAAAPIVVPVSDPTEKPTVTKLESSENQDNDATDAPVETIPSNNKNTQATVHCEKKKKIEGCEKHPEECKWNEITEKCDENSNDTTTTKDIVPTESPTVPPTGSPTTTPTKPPKQVSNTTPPSISPTKTPVKSEMDVPKDEVDECDNASTCVSCKEYSSDANISSDEICTWKNNKCITMKKAEIKGDEPDECPDANIDKNSKDSFVNPPIDEGDSTYPSGSLHYVFGALVLLVGCGIAVRRCRTRKLNHNTSSYGRTSGKNNFYTSSFPPSNLSSTTVKYEGVYVGLCVSLLLLLLLLFS
jgi:hypothetical protein